MTMEIILKYQWGKKSQNTNIRIKPRDLLILKKEQIEKQVAEKECLYSCLTFGHVEFWFIPTI